LLLWITPLLCVLAGRFRPANTLLYKEKLNIKMIQLIIGIIVIGFGAMTMWYGGHLATEGYKRWKEPIFTLEQIKQLSPSVDIKLFPFPANAASPYKFPLRQFVLTIQNVNSNSAPIQDFRVEFLFPYVIKEIKANSLLNTGGNVSVGSNFIYEEKKDGTTFHYEEEPIKSELTNNFNMSIQKAKLNGKNINTNVAVFNSARWPEGSAFSAYIIVDTSKTPEIMRKSDKVGKFEGVYYFVIKEKKHSKKVAGDIPEIKNEREEQDRAIWVKKLAQVDPNSGSLVFNTSDKKWLEKNNDLINFIPHTKVENFELHIYRDTDNIFKVLISNSFSKNQLLTFKDLDLLKKSPNHPKHQIAITWGDNANKLYLDGKLVDSK
jgi:hypothetical protein